MEQVVAALQGLHQGRDIVQVALDDLDVKAVQVAAVAARSGQRLDRQAFGDQLADDGGTDETGGAGDQGGHGPSPGVAFDPP